MNLKLNGKQVLLFSDYIHWRGGTWNVSRVKACLSGQCWGYFELKTSEVLPIEKLEKKMISFLKKKYGERLTVE